MMMMMMLMNFIKVSCLIAQARCLTNWGLTNYLLRAFLQSNLSTKATLRTEESGRCGEVAVSGGSTVLMCPATVNQ